MLEIWFAKARNGMAKQDLKPLRWLRVFPPGGWIILAVVFFVGGRLLWINTNRPAHQQERATAFGSVNLFYGVPQMNYDGSQIAYVASTGTRGVGLFVYDTLTGQKRQVDFQKDASGRFNDIYDLQAGPWSPDDSAFIYSMGGSLFVCQLDTNWTKTELSLSTNAATCANPFWLEDTIFRSAEDHCNITWLNPSEFVWLEGEIICQAKKSADGKWNVQRLPHQGQILNLTAVGPHSIAWLQEGFVCHLDLSKDLTGTNNPFAPWNQDDYTVPATNDLVLWLDASTLQLSNHEPVTLLSDLSSKKNHAIVDKNPPIYNAPDSINALNGKGTIHLESGETNVNNVTGLKTSNPLGIEGAQPRSVFAVMRRDNNRRMLINLGTSGGTGSYFGLCDQSDGLFLPAGWGVADSRFARLPAQWNILEAMYDGATQSSYVNGSCLGKKQTALKTVDTPVEIGFRIDSRRSSTNVVASDGDFAELLIYNRILSHTEQRQVEDYLSAKWFGTRPLPPKSPMVWFDPGMDNLTGFSYSRDTGKLLIKCTENNRDTLWFLDSLGGSNQLAKVTQGHFLPDVQWTGPREFVCVSRENGHRGLVLADLSGEQNPPLFGHANIGWVRVTQDKKQVLFWGNVSNGPAPGIWQYNLVTGQLRSVISSSEYPSTYARRIDPFKGLIKLPSGRSVSCTIYPPANFDRRKKYPLVIGDTVISDPVHVQAGIAACGAYVVMVDRRSWFGEIDHWEEDVRAVYEYLAQDPCIDTKQVYLLGASAETPLIGKCLEKTPGLWKGAIFLNPSGLPDFSKSPMFQGRPKILISAGSNEFEDERLKKFQRDALQSGVIIEFMIHPTETHRLIGTTSKQVRLQAIMHFIFEE